MKTKFSVYFDELEHYFTEKRSEATYLRNKQDIYIYIFFSNIHDLVIPVPRSNQLSYEANESCQFVKFSVDCAQLFVLFCFVFLLLICCCFFFHLAAFYGLPWVFSG